MSDLTLGSLLTYNVRKSREVPRPLLNSFCWFERMLVKGPSVSSDLGSLSFRARHQPSSLSGRLEEITETSRGRSRSVFLRGLVTRPHPLGHRKEGSGVVLWFLLRVLSLCGHTPSDLRAFSFPIFPRLKDARTLSFLSFSPIFHFRR